MIHSVSQPQYAQHSVLAAGERVSQAQLRDGWDSPPVQRTLFAARQRFGYALCECRPEPLKLQIRLRDGKCHLAVWPQERPAHDCECIFFRDDVADRASAMGGPRANLKLPAEPEQADGPVPHTRQRIALWVGREARSDTHVCPVTVKSLGQCLWEAASLCRWHPGWSRDWGRTRYQLHKAALEFTLNGVPLEELLFVPRPFREGRASALNEEWDAFARSLIAQPNRAPRLLIAPVRRIVDPNDQRGAAVFLRHLLGPIGVAPACFDFVSRDCRTALANSRLGAAQRVREPNGAPGTGGRCPELVGFFLVEGNSRAAVCARAGWLMAVHPSTYIPAPSSNVVMLIDSLVRGGYAFQHLVSPAPPGRRTEPDWLVRHVRGPDGARVARAALEVLAPSVSPQYLAARRALAARMAQQDIPTWVWTPSGPPGERRVPQLPPADGVPSLQAARTLQQILDSTDVDYGYGFSGKFTSCAMKPAAPGEEKSSCQTRAGPSAVVIEAAPTASRG
jgi:hypothetical protein